MADYISREAVMSKCDEMWENADETTQTGVATINAIDRITDFIESLPTADVQPVKRGRWIGEEVIQCSNCNFTLNGTSYGRIVHKYFSYCPNCGARMDGEK